MPDVDHTSDQDRVGALFSTAASDNAEVVPPHEPHGPESMWSTAANAAWEPQVEDGIVDGEVVEDRVGSGPAGAPPPGPPPPPPPNGATWVSAGNAGAHIPPRFSGIFTAEPVERPDDVVDEDDVDLDRGVANGARPAGAAPRPSTSTGEPLFSSSRVAPTAPDPWSRADPHAPTRRNGAPVSPFAAPEPAPRNGTARPRAADPQSAAPRTATRSGPPPAPPMPPSQPPPVAPDAVRLDGHLGGGDSPDPNGLRAAIARLDPRDVELTAVPIAVCGALLQTGESVLGAVTGQMLGRPAVVVVTNVRVLVVNDRRWQPIVDEFTIDSQLVVRGRHDRNVAALSFADPTRLAMVDGITEVGLAIELAERIRDAGSA